MWGNSDRDEENMRQDAEVGIPKAIETEPLIPLKPGDKVVSAVLVHPNKVIAVTRHGRVYRIDPIIPATCVEISRI